MAEDKVNNNIPKIGMKLSKPLYSLEGAEFSLLLNGEIQSVDNDFLVVSNSTSNLLCSRFKPGYKVIGILPINIQNKTIFFLVNPITNQSEIGYINNISYSDVADKTANCEDCNHPTIEEELDTLVELCKYVTIVNADCLNFSIDYPISATYEIGIDIELGIPDNNNTTIFFTDDLNTRRYLNISDYPKTIKGYGDCNTPFYTQELDCEAIRMVPKYNQACISLIDTPLGGSNPAGVYQFVTAYSNVKGDVLTDYSVVTNPISLFSLNHVVTINTDYNTNKSIKIEINNLSNRFNYINLVVLKTINSNTEAFLVGTFPINSNSLTYTYTGNNTQQETRVTLDDILKKTAIYEYAKGVITANRHLFWYNLKDQREINLQPVVSEFIHPKWQTSEALEGFYANPISANYVSFERDEIVPLAIEFYKDNGFRTATFPLIAPPSGYYYTNYTMDDVLHNGDMSPLNVNAIQTSNNVLQSGGCESTELNKLWQVYNSAQVIGQSSCYSNPTGDITITEFIKKQCFSNTWIDGDTPELSCCSPSGSCEDVTNPDYCCCTLQIVTPSGNITVNTFDCNLIVIDNPVPPPSGYIFNNDSCTTAKPLNTSPNNECSPELQGEEGVLGIPYLYLPSAGNTPSNLLCDGTTQASDNANYFSFQASSQYHVVSTYSTTPTDLVIQVFASCEDADNNNLYLNIDGSDACSETGCLKLNSLVEGKTYILKVFTKSGASSDYPQICVNTPIFTGTEEIAVPTVYRWSCEYYDGTISYTVKRDPTCLITPFEYGDPAYWESTLIYPENKDVWGNLCGQPIRHFKFPDCCVSHIHDNFTDPTYGIKNKIYPIGIQIDITQVKEALNQAVIQGLLTREEKLQITGYSIKRGNRRNNRSIIAKGLLYDMMRTFQLDANGHAVSPLTRVYYPNYPFNDLHDDPLLCIDSYNYLPIKHPYFSSGNRNNRYTFHSPNTSFNKPELGTELKLETVERGQLSGVLAEVEKHSKYVIPSKTTYDVAKVLAGFQINHEAAASAMSFSMAVLGTGGSIIGWAIGYAIGLGFGFASNFGKYVNNYVELIKSLGTPFNPTTYQVNKGWYAAYCCVSNNTDEVSKKRATLSNGLYLNSGNYTFTEQSEVLRINNYERESSVYLSISDELNGQTAFDNSFFPPPNQCGVFDSSKIAPCTKNVEVNPSNQYPVVSYYASIKNYVPDQYGTIDQIEWLDTGYCGTIDWSNPSGNTLCDTIYGGDTYINRFSLKRKFPFFLQDRVGFEENNPVLYSELGNVGQPTYWFNSVPDEQSKEEFGAPFYNPPRTRFNCIPLNDKGKPKKPFYKEGIIYLYDYGIPSYICESDYNVDLRHAEDFNNYKDFYPHVGDAVQWTQQYKNPISLDNTFYYNPVYSKQNRENFYHILPSYFSNSLTTSRADYPNRTIFSPQGVPNWFNYLAVDYYDFPIEDGRLIALNPIEQQAVLVRQENSAKVFNAFITVESSLATIAITAGDMFQQKPREYYRTDLGYAGSTNTALSSTPFGHFYVDTQNPSVLQLQGDSLKDITRDKDNHNKIQWFNEFLPFQISKDFPEVDTDNNFKYFGIALTWDNKNEKFLLTKRDAKLRAEYKDKVTFLDNKFYFNQQEIKPTDNQYFIDKSFTIGYSPLINEWISYYSYKPNYYLSTETNFSSGVNYPTEVDNEIGIFTHNLTQKSYTIFYGKEYPFIVEFAIKSNLQSNILNCVETSVTFDRFQEDLNYYTKIAKFYDKGLIYNSRANTGNLIFEIQQPNNSFQLLNNGKITPEGTTTLVSSVQDFMRFNYFYDNSRNNGTPNLSYQSQIFKELNPLSVDYTPKYVKNRILGDFFCIRLESNEHLYRISHRFSLSSIQTSIL